jgi:hypothetical protein
MLVTFQLWALNISAEPVVVEGQRPTPTGGCGNFQCNGSDGGNSHRPQSDPYGADRLPEDYPDGVPMEVAYVPNRCATAAVVNNQQVRVTRDSQLGIRRNAAVLAFIPYRNSLSTAERTESAGKLFVAVYADGSREGWRIQDAFGRTADSIFAAEPVVKVFAPDDNAASACAVG